MHWVSLSRASPLIPNMGPTLLRIRYQTLDLLPLPLDSTHGNYPPPPRNCYRRLIVTTEDLFKLVHFRTYIHYWHLVVATEIRTVGKLAILLACFLVTLFNSSTIVTDLIYIFVLLTFVRSLYSHQLWDTPSFPSDSSCRTDPHCPEYSPHRLQGSVLSRDGHPNPHPNPRPSPRHIHPYPCHITHHYILEIIFEIVNCIFKLWSMPILHMTILDKRVISCM